MPPAVTKTGTTELRLGFASRLAIYLRDGYAVQLIEDRRQPGIHLRKNNLSIFVVTSTTESAQAILLAAKKLA
jgi:hypothetical protein